MNTNITSPKKELKKHTQMFVQTLLFVHLIIYSALYLLCVCNRNMLFNNNIDYGLYNNFFSLTLYETC